MSGFVVPDDTIHSQRRAADPATSAWVSANAGAGKTKVLSDRVLRLLLAGVRPGRILCLTFTKAAAANMAIRVFDRLGAWVTKDAAALRAELTELEGRAPDAKSLARARCLFAKAVETPGGLKIETIHAFCERLLHMAPFEANVPARFAVLEDMQAAELREEATANAFAAAAAGDSVLGSALEAVSDEAAGDTLAGALREALACRDAFTRPGGVAETLDLVRSRLGLDPSDDEDAVARAILGEGFDEDEIRRLAGILRATGATTDSQHAERLEAVLTAVDREERLEAVREVFFTDKGEPRQKLGTKAAGADVQARLADERDRLVPLFERRRAVLALARTTALFTLAADIRRRIEDEKRRLGALDFQDLIDRTRALLESGYGPWVLYKLDRGIDHVLIDEAQDTNPEQWDILQRITEDFTSGAGAASGVTRTVFAVGDPKQSIYGFQGADPRRFEDGRRHWRAALAGAKLGFEEVRLTLSFRSVKTVLAAVDATFAVEAHLRGVSFEEARAVATVHATARPGVPGRVELWPVVLPEKDAGADAWTLPVDQPDTRAPPVRVAQRIAATIARWTGQGDETGRIWRPGEILVLVRKRGPAFEAMNRALKNAGIPVAGADRLDIAAHIGVEDLVSAASAALLPQDDLKLAEALKSPLVALTDEDLVTLACGRGARESLAEAITRHAEAGSPVAERAARHLARWRDLARAHGPFGFFATLLGPEGGRRALVARLGAEAGDAIDAFLAMAHEYELRATPSLSGFLAGFAGSNREIKRDLEAGRDEVRVMTVHGAKGLEAEAVFLLDGCGLGGRGSQLLSLARDAEPALPLWCPSKPLDCTAAAQARASLKTREIEEHNRLLYVAMTRAKERLVVAPYATNETRIPAEAWCRMIEAGLDAHGAGQGLARADEMTAEGPIRVWHDGAPARPATAAAAPAAPPLEIPAWLFRPAPQEAEPAPPLRPSGALAAADRPVRPGEGRFSPVHRLRGVLVHALLERLPDVPGDLRADAARRFVEARAPGLPPAVRSACVAQALAVLDDPRLALLFGPGSRAEAPIAGRIVLPGESEGRAVSGQIDRLLIAQDRVIFADFKTTARPPDPGAPVPPAYLTQAALYRDLLRRLVPGRPVEGYLIWTAGVTIRAFTDDELDASLAQIIPS